MSKEYANHIWGLILRAALRRGISAERLAAITGYPDARIGVATGEKSITKPFLVSCCEAFNLSHSRARFSPFEALSFDELVGLLEADDKPVQSRLF